MELLRIVTAGSVDDGKSTLIGRLLYEGGAIADDQLQAIARVSRRAGKQEIDLSFLTDGLKAEREQGITIDVAYRYFSTARRKFILIDAPGHAQYTRNMVTGTSNADVAVILIDAEKGVLEQTQRHTRIASLLGVEGIVVCVNKMDRVGYAERVFREIVTEFRRSIQPTEGVALHFLPISALDGDNVTVASPNTPWYDGPPLMEFLETFPIGTNATNGGSRFGVQWVVRPRGDRSNGYRGYAGRVLQGEFRTGDDIVVLPAGQRTRIRSIELDGLPLDIATAPRSIVMRFEDEIDIGRGDLIAGVEDQPTVGHRIEAEICWMSEHKLTTGRRLFLQSMGLGTPCIVDEIPYKVDVTSGAHLPPGEGFELNDIGRIALRTASPIVYDTYTVNRQSGSFILIDERDNMTVAAGLIR